MSSPPFIFISYSHQDSKWLEDFKIQLKPYLRNINRNIGLKVWDDQQIEVGAKWRDEIEKALTSATIAVLLVSPDFLASNFIHDEEIPKFLKAAEKDGLTVFWIPIRSSSYKITPINDYQAAYPPNQPIARMSPEDRDDAWVKICEKLGEILQRQPAPVLQQVAAQDPPVRPPKATENKTQPPAAKQSQPGREHLEDLSNDVTLRMISIPGGSFVMGAPSSEQGSTSDERPQHVVTVESFLMGKYPVTQKQ